MPRLYQGLQNVHFQRILLACSWHQHDLSDFGQFAVAAGWSQETEAAQSIIAMKTKIRASVQSKKEASFHLTLPEHDIIQRICLLSSCSFGAVSYIPWELTGCLSARARMPQQCLCSFGLCCPAFYESYHVDVRIYCFGASSVNQD